MYCLLSRIFIFVELVGTSIVGLWGPVVLPGTGARLHTEVRGLPEGPVAATGLEGRQVSMSGSLVSGVRS